MTKYWICIILLFFQPVLLFGRGKEGKELMDSLEAALSTIHSDTAKVQVQLALASASLDIDQKTSQANCEQALALARRLNYKMGIARAYNMLGSINNFTGNVDEALKDDSVSLAMYRDLGNKAGMASCYYNNGMSYAYSNYDEALKNLSAAVAIFREVGDKRRTAACYSVIGSVYTYKSDYPQALNNFFAGLKAYEAAGIKTGIAGCSANLGMVYIKEGDNTAALKYFADALRVFEELGIKSSIAACHQNIAGVYFNLDNYADARKHYNLALQLYAELNFKYGIADVYGAFGGIYEEEAKWDSALHDYFAALAIYREINNRYSVGKTLLDISNDLGKQKKYRECVLYANQGLDVAKEVQSLDLQAKGYGILKETYPMLGEYKKALAAYDAYITARDSVLNNDNTKKIVQAQMQYDFEKKESAVKAEQAKKDAEVKLKLHRRNTLMYGAVSAFAALLIIGTLLLRQSKLKANQQRVELEQKQLRAQMNPHFIFNCLNSIQHFVVANDVKNANKYLSGFALLMRQTLENSKQGVITLRREIEYLENYLVLETMRFEDKFTYEIICDDDLNKDTVEIPAMIIQPFVENAIRHGLCYIEGRQGKLKIKFYRKDNYLYCEVDDNGIGREQSQRLKTGSDIVYESQGMELTRQRLALVSRSVGSEYKLEIIDKKNVMQTAEGTTVIIKFPLES